MISSLLAKFDWSTRMAVWKSCISSLPTMWKSGADFQQVRSWQLPERPWHLQRTFILREYTCTVWIEHNNCWHTTTTTKHMLSPCTRPHYIPIVQHGCYANWFSTVCHKQFPAHLRITSRSRRRSWRWVNNRPISSVYSYFSFNRQAMDHFEMHFWMNQPTRHNRPG